MLVSYWAALDSHCALLTLLIGYDQGYDQGNDFDGGGGDW